MISPRATQAAVIAAAGLIPKIDPNSTFTFAALLEVAARVV
jgi:hypothetical protein